MTEVDNVRERYRRRETADGTRYSLSKADVFAATQQLDHRIMQLFRENDLVNFEELSLLEVGCGTGSNLLRFLRWGFNPGHLTGNELLEQRAEVARQRLPMHTKIYVGDALCLPNKQYDIVFQSTVLSSLLDSSFQMDFAKKMWALTKPRGAVISYDFTFNNPSNKDVHRVSKKRLSELFPDGIISSRRVTLAPPLARAISRHPLASRALGAVPPLRTHLLCLIHKPSHSGDPKI